MVNSIWYKIPLVSFRVYFAAMWVTLLFILFSIALVRPQEEKGCAPYTPGDYVMSSRVPTHCEMELMNCTRSWKAGIPLGRSTDPPLVDSNFIICQEGLFRCVHVSIDPATGKVADMAGVKVGGGVDLSARDRAYFSNIGIAADVINLLEPYFGIKSGEAACAVIDIPRTLLYDQALTLTNAVIDAVVNLVQTRYDMERTGGTLAFASLPKAMRTAISDVWFHFGAPENYPDLWGYVIRNDWDNAIDAFRNFYDVPTRELIGDVRRRFNEADIVSAALEKCNRSADVVFLLDESGSISSNDFTLSLDFIEQIITAFPDETLANPKGTRFALSVFGSSYLRKFNLMTYDSISGYTSAVSSVSKRGGSTYLGDALNNIVTSQFTESNGLRLESLGFPKVLIVLTDGKATDAIDVPSQNVLANNIVIYAIGIGNYDRDQLNTIASSPTHVYLLATFSDLSEFAVTLTASACYEPQPLSFRAVISGELQKDEFQYFEYKIQLGNYLQIILTNIAGNTHLFASRETPHPYQFDNNFGVSSSSSARKEIVISPVSSSRLRRIVNATNSIYVSIQGTSNSNTFTLVGSPCDPAICMQGASGANHLQVSISVLILLCAVLLSF